MDDRDFYDNQYASTYKNSSSNQLAPTDPSKYYRYSGFAAGTSDTFTAKLAAKSNCQIQLSLTPEIIPRGPKENGLKVESDAIKLMPQVSGMQGNRTDSSEINVTVTNSMLRNYPGKQGFKYDIVYKGDGFEKRVPVEVIVWNPRYALQVSRNIELYLGPDQSGNYSAQVPLFVRNIGEADIENVNFRVSSSTSRGNVDLRVSPDFPIQFLKKGDSINPPKTLVAQVLRNEKTTPEDIKELDITGVIDGATFSFGPIIVTSHISAAQCLTAVPGNLTFISSVSSQGALAQDITLRNTCAEEARIIGISQPAIGNNIIYLYPQNAIIPRGAEAKFSVRLEKKEDYSGSPQPLYIHAFLPISATPIDSTPVWADIKLGKNVSKGTAATEEIEIPVCEGGANKKVRFPIIASGTNPLCDTAYCDAVQLSNFLANRIEDKVRDAEKQMQNRSATIQKTDCSQADLARGFCTFDGLGVKNETFFVYFSQDNLSPAIVNRSLEGKNSSVKNFRAQFFEGTSGGLYIGGYGKQVFLNNNIRGCGRYAITLNGTVAVQGSGLVPDLMNIVVDVQHDTIDPARQITEQCTARVENLGNFLPRDEGLAANSRLDTWMGIVQAKDRALEDLAGEVAKGLFGSDSRSSAIISGTNTLTLDLGNTEGNIVRIDMDRVQSDNPVNIRATIRGSIGSDEQLQKEIATEAGQALRNIRDTGANINGCIGSDSSYLLIKSNKDLGKVEAKIKDGFLNVQYDNETCQDFNVTSNIKETVNLSARKETNFDGLVDGPIFKKKPASTNAIPTEVITAISTDKLDMKTNRFVGEALICVKGDSQFAQAQGKKIIAEAKRVEGQDKVPKNDKAELRVCGIHPLKFMEKSKTLDATKGENSYYYATFIWKGNPDQILFSDMQKLSAVEQRSKSAEELAKNPNGVKQQDTPEVIAAKKTAGYWYLGACGATSIATSLARPLIGWGLAIINFAADCGIPYIGLVGETDTQIKSVLGFIDTALLKPIKKAFELFTGGLSWLFTGMFKALGVGTNAEALEKARNLEPGSIDATESVIGTFVDTAVVKDTIIASWASVWGDTLTNDTMFAGNSDKDLAINLSKTRTVANNVAETVTENISKNMFGVGVKSLPRPGPAADLMELYLEKISAATDEDLKELIRKSRTFSKGTFGLAQRTTIKQAQDSIIKNALPKAEAELLKDSRYLPALSATRQAGRIVNTFGLKTGDVQNEVLDELKKEIDSAMLKPKETFLNAVPNGTSITRASLGINGIENSYRDSFVDTLEKKLKLTVRTIRGNPAFMTKLRTVRMPIPKPDLSIAGVATFTMNDQSIKAFQDELANLAFEEIKANTHGIPSLDTKFQERLDKKIASPAGKRITEVAKEGVDAAAAKPKFFSGAGQLGFWKNLLKEGAFGLLSNYVGLKFYDFILQGELGKVSGEAKIQARDIPAAAQAAYFGQTFAPIDDSTRSILKYRTYKISVTSNATTGAKEIKLGPAKSIPSNVDAKKYVLDDCVNPGFEDDVGAVLPGLIPEVENVSNFPKPMQATKEMQNFHVKAADSYLKKRANGERYGTLIASAVKDPQTGLNRPEFAAFASTGLNLEAMVAGIGEVKSALGDETLNPQLKGTFMFGCDAKINNITVADVYNNAYCAAKKITQFMATECATKQGDPTCYFSAYNRAAGNESGGILKISDAEFGEVYTAWKNYAWRAS